MLRTNFRAIAVLIALAPEAATAAHPLAPSADNHVDVAGSVDADNLIQGSAPETDDGELSFNVNADWGFCVTGTHVNIDLTYNIQAVGIKTDPVSKRIIEIAAEDALTDVKRNSNSLMVEAGIDTDEEVNGALNAAVQPIAEAIFSNVATAINERDLMIGETVAAQVEVIGIDGFFRVDANSPECGNGGIQNASLEHYQL